MIRRIARRGKQLLCSFCKVKPQRGYLDGPDLTPDDIFLVSYPRSGNTWLSTIIAYMLYPESDIQSLRDVARLLPAPGAIDPYFNGYSTPRVIKSHQPFFIRHERTNRDLYKRNIYMLRHPFDVTLSYFDYGQGLYRRPEANTFDRYVEMFVSGAIGPGHWQSHVLSWYVMRDELDILFLRYEDLKADTLGVIQQVAGFLGQDVDEERARELQQLASRESMVKLEERGSPVAQGYDFVRRQSDVPRGGIELTEEHKRLIMDHNRHAMELFDYGTK